MAAPRLVKSSGARCLLFVSERFRWSSEVRNALVPPAASTVDAGSAPALLDRYAGTAR